MNEDKKALREKFRAVRKSAKSEDKDSKIFVLTVESDFFLCADTVFLYCSVGSEADTLRIINYALSAGKRVALPKCTDRNGSMDFYYITDTEKSLTDGMFSLKEPDSDVCDKAYATEASLCIVPALAVDKRGYRLGYGGGYYDRFLSSFKGIRAGLCYEECFCEELPYDEHDIRLNRIITDYKIYEIK